MNIWFHDYFLNPVQTLNARSKNQPRAGALLKIETVDGIGYADLHPWPELGDLVLKKQLQNLAAGEETALLRQSLWCARRDARARSTGKALLSDLGTENNALFELSSAVDTKTLHESLDVLATSGYRVLKIKCGVDLSAEVRGLEQIARRQDFQMRLDFNSSLSFSALKDFMAALPESCDEKIEYVEDPCAYNAAQWNEIRKRWKLGLDFEMPNAGWPEGDAPAADVIILKPARTAVEKTFERCRDLKLPVTVTSSMDHPVGVMHALAVAQEAASVKGLTANVAGCLTLDVYEDNAFSRLINRKGSAMQKPEGFGIGFDQLLGELPWRSISDL